MLSLLDSEACLLAGFLGYLENCSEPQIAAVRLEAKWPEVGKQPRD